MPHATAGWRPSRWFCLPAVSRFSGPLAGWGSVRACADTRPARIVLRAAPHAVRSRARNRADGLSLGFSGTRLDPVALAAAFGPDRGAWPDASGGRRSPRSGPFAFLPHGSGRWAWRRWRCFSRPLLPFSHRPRRRTDAPVVRLIQPNAPQHLKWQPDIIPVFWQQGRDLTARAPRSRAWRAGPRGLAGDQLSGTCWTDPTPRALQLSVASAGAPVLIGAQRVEDFRAQHPRAGRGGGALARSMTSTTSCRSGNTCRSGALPTSSWHRGARGGPAGRLQRG
jgi:hypothetical protein